MLHKHPYCRYTMHMGPHGLRFSQAQLPAAHRLTHGVGESEVTARKPVLSFIDFIAEECASGSHTATATIMVLCLETL